KANGSRVRVAFAPDGRTLAFSHRDVIALWDLAGGRKRAEFSAGAPCGPGGTLVVFSSTGKWLATAGEADDIKVWDAATLKEVCTIQSHQGAVTSLAFFPHDRWLVSGGLDKTIRIWQLPKR